MGRAEVTDSMLKPLWATGRLTLQLWICACQMDGKYLPHPVSGSCCLLHIPQACCSCMWDSTQEIIKVGPAVWSSQKGCQQCFVYTVGKVPLTPSSKRHLERQAASGVGGGGRAEPAETFLPEGSLLGVGVGGLDLSIPTPTCLAYLWVIHEPCPAHRRCQGSIQSA